MPQMAPLSWFLLFMMFSLTLILFNMMNYYIYTQHSPSTQHSVMNTPGPLNWKW
nr:ATP synthase F0 subunit 8 [Paraleptophlebia submarginata]